jgi:hypothetical protein
VANKPRYKHRIRPPDAKYWYQGDLRVQDLPKGEIKRAYQSWIDQRYRCSNKKSESYKYYGGKGIKVLYSSREFIGWWLHEIKKKRYKKPTISRLNHDGNYEFNNIKLEEHIDNCVIDTIKRNGPPSWKQRRKIVILDKISNKVVHVSDSTVDAGLWAGVPRGNISNMCLHKPHWTGNGYRFRYYEDWIKLK